MRPSIAIVAGWAALAVPATPATPAKVPPPSAAQASPAPSAFGAIALPVRSTRFDSRWQRVLRTGTASGAWPGLIAPARAAPRLEQLRLVNAALNQRVRYRFDSDPNGDRWATAEDTLRASSGDCEDYAIAKLHALRALGVPASDLYMVIGHDSIAGAVHALLVARAGRQAYVLDNRTSQLVPQQFYRGFHPIIAFGAEGAWLYGYPRGRTPPAVVAMNEALRSKRGLPIGNSRGSAVQRSAAA